MSAKGAPDQQVEAAPHVRKEWVPDGRRIYDDIIPTLAFRTVKSWADTRVGDNRKTSVYHLAAYIRWRKAQGLSTDPDQWIEECVAGTNRTLIEHLRQLKEWVEGPELDGDTPATRTEKIINDLEKNHIQTQIIECNVLNTSEVVNEVGSIVTASPQHDYLFNVSTGARTASIAGVIAGMFWHVRPYYVAVDDQAKSLTLEGDFPTIGSPQFIPTFEIPLLERKAIEALEYIAGKNEPIPKRSLIGYLKETGIVGPRQKEEVSEQALYGQLDSILQKLDAWGFVDLIGRGKLMRIRITDRGIEGRKMFFHMSNPRKPLSVLMSKS
jgi:hypothetical protein